MAHANECLYFRVWNLPALEQEHVGQGDEDSSPSFSCASSELGNGHAGTPVHEKLASCQEGLNTADASAATKDLKKSSSKCIPNVVTFSDAGGASQASCSSYNPVSLTTGVAPAPYSL